MVDPKAWVESILKLKRKIIIVFGGGTGIVPVIEALVKKYGDQVYIVAVVPSTDRGGSTGILLGMNGEALPPGDAIKALLALLVNQPDRQQIFREFFGYRFDERYGQMAKHSLGNLVVTAALGDAEDPDSSLERVARLCNILNGSAIYASHSRPSELMIRRQNGQVTRSEKDIDEQRTPHDSPIADIWLEPSAPTNPKLIELMKVAWGIVIAGGSFTTSTCPNIITEGFAASFTASPAKKLMVTNLANEPGHTDGWTAIDYVEQTLQHLRTEAPQAAIDHVIINDPDMVASSIIQWYRKADAELTLPGQKPDAATYTVSITDLASNVIESRQANDPVAQRSLLRHDPAKLSAELGNILGE